MQSQEDSPIAASDIEQRVREMLDAAKVPALRGIGVEVKDGSLVLTGGVKSYYEKQLATELARRAFGACPIVNLIQVSYGDHP